MPLLTGAREVIIADALDPEKSYNLNVNVVRKVYFKSGAMLGLDASTWYTYFTNQIVPDYDSDPNQIIYDTLEWQLDHERSFAKRRTRFHEWISRHGWGNLYGLSSLKSRTAVGD